MIRLIETQSDLVSEYPRVREWLLSALNHSTNPDEAALLNGLVSRQYQLWTGDECACVTELATLDHRRVCWFYLVAGNAVEIFEEGFPVVERWAREHECQAFGLTGRKGWERNKQLKSYGFEMKSVTLMKEIDGINT